MSVITLIQALPPSESLACHDVMCSNKQHIAQLNSYSNQIIRAYLESVASTITSTSRPTSGARKLLPGWNEYVLAAREKSILWHNIWLECGRPRDGAVADIMRRTRAAYHYAVSYIKHNNSDFVKQRFASAIFENRSKDFWHKVKKVRGGKGYIQRTVDGHTQNDFIADLFANKYENIYTSVRYDQTKMDGLRQDIEDKVTAAGYDSNCIITFENIVNASSKLKPGKHDGHYGLSSDQLNTGKNIGFL